MSTTEKSQSDIDKRELGNSDLQLLLRPKLGKQVIVLRSTTSSFLQAGENFACCLSKVTVTVKRDENQPEETLNCVAKLFPLAESIKAVFDFRKLFEKEIFFYEKLLPALKELEIEFGARNNETHDLAPKLFGSRLSADPNANKIDEDVLILMENLKAVGYYTLDKIQGSDLSHSKMAIKTLARFHALGIACKQHRPKFFQDEVLAQAVVVPYQQDNDKGNIFEIMGNMLLKDPRIAKYAERILKLLDPEMMQVFFEYVAPEPWLSIVHLDFWTNNVLYCKDKSGNLTDVKFIDFQNYAYNSPLRDLPYFLCTSTSHEVMTKHFDELLDLYYDTFVDVLKTMHCDVSPFTRKSFDEQLKIDASFEFFHNILAIKFFSAEIDKDTYDPSDLESVVIYSDVNALGYDKWYQIILTYVERGWM